MKKAFAFSGICLISLGLFGCSAIQTSSEHSTLQVNSSEKNSVFLSPFATEQKSIYIKVINSADPSINVVPPLSEDLIAKGYTIVTDPKLANQIVEINIAAMTRTVNASGSTGAKVADAATGGAIAGLAASAAVQHSINANPWNASNYQYGGEKIAGAAILGALGTAIVDAMVQDVTFTVETHVDILTLASSNTTQAASKVNTPSSTTGPAVLPTTTATITTNTVVNNNGINYTLTQVWQSTQTDITTTADKVDLTMQGAAPAIASSIASSIANIF